MNLWLSYPFSALLRFMEDTGLQLFGHVIRIGPIAFAVIYRKRAQPVPPS